MPSRDMIDTCLIGTSVIDEFVCINSGVLRDFLPYWGAGKTKECFTFKIQCEEDQIKS